MESSGWPKPSELRALASRLVQMADAIDGREIGNREAKISSLDDFRNGIPKIRPQHSAPTADLAEAIYRDRQRRAKFLPSVPLTEPAWDVLLDIYFRTCRNERVSVSNACVASGVPSATALRWIDLLIEGGLIRREADDADRRRTWLMPTEQCMTQMEAYLSTLYITRSARQLLAS